TTSTVSGTNPEGNWGFTPDSQKVFYRNNTIGVREAFLVDLTTTPPGAPQKLDGVITAVGSPVGVGAVSLTNVFQFAPDSTQVSYVSEQNENDVVELFLNDITGGVPGTPVQISPTPVTGGDVIDPGWTSDSAYLFFLGDLVQDAQSRLFVFD